MKYIFAIALALAITSCAAPVELQTTVEEHEVPVPALEAEGLPASSDSLWNILVDSLLARLEQEPRVIEREVPVPYWRDRPLTFRDYTATHITPSLDTTDILFHLDADPDFSFSSRRGPLKYSEKDTVTIVKPTIEETPFLSKLGLVALGFIIAIIAMALVLIFKPKIPWIG